MPNKSYGKPKTAAERNTLSISAYLEKMNEYLAYPGRVVNGQLFVLYQGNWISKQEFDKFVKRPIVPTFLSNKNNFDRTMAWMFE